MLRIISVLQVCKSGVLPSDIMEIEDGYTAFCFNEACAYILAKLNEGEKPFIRKEIRAKAYSKPSDFYDKFN